MITHTRFLMIFLSLFCILLLQGSTSSAWAEKSVDLTARQDALQLLENSPGGLRVAYTFSRIQSFEVQTERGTFSHISMPGLTHSTRIGAPKLPVSRRIISVPLEARVLARAVSFEREEIPLAESGIDHPIMPAQPSLSKSQSPEDMPFEYREESYAIHGFGDRPLVQVEELGILRGLRLFRLIVEPVRYDPSSQVIEVYNNLEVEIEFSGGDFHGTENLRWKSWSPYYEAVYQRWVLNYIPLDMPKDDLTRYPIKYIIVSDPMFEAQLQPFIEWKTQQGFEVFVGYVGDPDVGSTTSSIKSYIQGIYNAEEPKPSFVLFVGDREQVPAWNGSTGGHITDLNYVRLEGSDYMPEMYYGRFSARNTDELQPQIDKTLEYERYEMPDPAFLGEVVMIAGMDSGHGSTWGNGQINYGTTYYFNGPHGIFSHTYLYPESGSNSANIINDVSNGVGYANYTAHGGTTSWSNPSFTISDINSLNNASEYPTVVGNCCLTNAFGTGTCFGEAWLRAENKGAIGYIGGTNSTYWDEDYWWGVGAGTIVSNPTYETHGLGAYDGMFHDHGEVFRDWYTTQYAVIMAGNLAVVEGGGSDNYYWEIYALMGDPSLSTYFAVPSANTVSYPGAILIGESSIQVTADQYSYVGLSKDGELCASGLVESRGQITLEFEPFMIPGQADLVITRQNREPVITTIDVIPNEGSYVVIDSTFIDDTTGGNGDFAIDVGENAALTVFLKNVGTQTASSVVGSLYTDQAEVTITDPVQAFGDLTSGQMGGSGAPYGVDLGTVDDGASLPFYLKITAAESLWIRDFLLQAHAPILAQEGWQINDASGNGNGRPDPGETVELTIVVGNTGSGDAANAQLTLDDSDPYVTITEPSTQSLGQILSGNQVTSPSFVVTFDVACPEAYAAIIPIQFASNGGAYSNTGSLTLIVGQRELLFVDSDNETTEGRIVTALDAWGGSYRRLDVHNQETVPVDTLLSYRMVLWSAGDQNVSSLTEANQTNMASYLDQGGALLFTAENYLTSYGSTSFTSDYLHVGSYETSISGTNIVGEPGDPIGDGISLTLSYPSGLAEYPDRVTPDAEAAVVFRMEGSNDPIAIRYPGSGSSVFRVVFFGVALEAFPSSGMSRNDVETVVSDCLGWLGGSGDFIAPTTPGDVIFAADGILSWSASTDNVGVDHYSIYRSTNAYFDVDGMTPLQTTAGTSASFPGSVGDPIINYYFRVTATDGADNESTPSNPVGEHDFSLNG